MIPASSSLSPAAPRRRGFTLLEVLLALAMFALAVTMLAASYINILEGLEAVKTDHAFSQEVRWIRSRVLVEPDRTVIEDGGEAKTLDFGTARWTATIEATPLADVFMVHLEVVLGDDKETLRRHRESFSVLRPSWSDPVEREKLRTDAKQRIEEDRRRTGVLSAKGAR